MYIAKALVRIEDANIRHRTFDKVVKMGYEMGLSDPYGIHPYILIGEDIVTIRAKNAVDKGYSYKPPIRSEGFIDCNLFTPNGTEEEAVRLFLELAQMREDAGSDERWQTCDCPHFDDMYDKTFERGEVIDSWKYQHVDMGLFSNAEPLEVAQAFKNGRI